MQISDPTKIDVTVWLHCNGLIELGCEGEVQIQNITGTHAVTGKPLLKRWCRSSFGALCLRRDRYARATLLSALRCVEYQKCENSRRDPNRNFHLRLPLRL